MKGRVEIKTMNKQIREYKVKQLIRVEVQHALNVVLVSEMTSLRGEGEVVWTLPLHFKTPN